MERVLLTRVLRYTHGPQAQVSKLLGLNRATLRHKLRPLGLAVDKILVDQPRRDGEGASDRFSLPLNVRHIFCIDGRME